MGDYFPNHDLDRPVVLPAFADDAAQEFRVDLVDGGSDFSTAERGPAPVESGVQNHASNGVNPSRLSRLSNLALRFSSRPGGSSSNLRLSPGSEAALLGTSIPFSVNNNCGRQRNGQDGLGHVKSIRKIAEEQASKRQSNPGKAHRQTGEKRRYYFLGKHPDHRASQ